MARTHHLGLLCAVVCAVGTAATGCSETDSTIAPDADVAAVDAALAVPDGAVTVPDAAVGTIRSELVGTWLRQRDGEDIDQFQFGADGSFAFDEHGGPDHLTGTFTATEERVFAVATSATGEVIDYMFSYYVNDTHLAFGAGLPVGDHDGVVGTWLFDLRIVAPTGTIGSRVELELRADGTGTRQRTPHAGGPSTTEEGTWGPADEVDDEPAGPNDYTFRVGSLGFTFTLIDDAVLGSLDYERVP